MLREVDTLVFDIQDIGFRFYSCFSTLKLAMEAAAETGVEFVILDRPNPNTGIRVEGPILEPRHQSFVGIAPIALQHGMTIGELARVLNEEGMLEGGRKKSPPRRHPHPWLAALDGVGGHRASLEASFSQHPNRGNSRSLSGHGALRSRQCVWGKANDRNVSP